MRTLLAFLVLAASACSTAPLPADDPAEMDHAQVVSLCERWASAEARLCSACFGDLTSTECAEVSLGIVRTGQSGIRVRTCAEATSIRDPAALVGDCLPRLEQTACATDHAGWLEPASCEDQVHF